MLPGRASWYSCESLLEHALYCVHRKKMHVKFWSLTAWNSCSLSAVGPDTRGHANTCVFSGFFANTKIVFLYVLLLFFSKLSGLGGI